MLCNKSIREDIGWQSHIQTAVPHFVSGQVGHLKKRVYSLLQ